MGSKEEMLINFLGRRIFIRPSTPDLNVAYSCFCGEFDALRDWINLNQKGMIIDAGGYIGTAAIVLSEMFPNTIVISIEPAINNYSLLVKNVADIPNIKPMHAALMPEAHSSPVQMFDRDAGEWGYVINYDGRKRATSVLAESVSIRKLMEIHNCEVVLAIKMDIEGSERALLLEASAWLPRTGILFVELHPELCQDIGEIYDLACKGRDSVVTGGEKRMSVLPQVLVQGTE